jgi:SulP family sulfate permease
MQSLFKNYSWPSARKDLVAGLTVAAICVPQAMAYALIAGVEPRYGLYSAIVVTAVASLFGSSAHLINGPTNAISLVVFSAIAFAVKEYPDNAQKALENGCQAMFLLGVMVGVIQILIAVFRLGDLTRYISESIVIGFMAGAGVLIALTQLPNVFGLKDRGSGDLHVLHRLWLTFTSGGNMNFRALSLALLTAVLVLVLRRVFKKFNLPRADMLLALTVAAVVASVLGWSAGDKPLVSIVGNIPAGLPGLKPPKLDLQWMRQMAGSSLAVACLGLLEALSIAKAIAYQTRQRLDFNKQCLAEGLGNFCGGFFQCLPGSGSLTRSAINFQAGAVSRWSGVFTAAAVALVVVLFAPLARFIPKAALGGILLVTAAGLIDIRRIGRAVRASRYDAGLVLATALSAVFIGVEFAILIGVVLSILMFVPRAARLKATELAVSPERVIRDRHADDPCCSKLALLDLEGEFFFGAATELERYFDDLRQRSQDDLKAIVLRVKRTRNPDMVCMELLQQFIGEMQQRGIVVFLCGVRPDFAEAMQNLDFARCLPKTHIYMEDAARPGSSTLAAVRAAYDLLGVDLCDHCPRHTPAEAPNGALYYQI